MAIVTQTEFLAGTLETFATLNNEPERNLSSEPFGILSHAANVEVDAIGANDDAIFILHMILPLGSCFILKSLVATLREGDATDTGNWLEPLLRMPYAKNNRDAHQGITVAVDYPILELPRQQLGVATAQEMCMGGYGGLLQGASGDAAGNGVPGPEFIQYGIDGATNTQHPSFMMQNLQPNQDTNNLFFVATWWAFNVEQANNSALHWNFPVRS